MKSYIRLITLVTFYLSIVATSFAQNQEIKRSNNKVSLNGQPYYIHIVRSGETFYRISQAYSVPADTIAKDNMHVNPNDLVLNQYLKIRVVEQATVGQKAFVYHKVEKNNTVFNIAQRYNISIDDIYKHNPEAEMGIKLGQVLKIPVKRQVVKPIETIEKPVLVQEDKQADFVVHTMKKKETIFGIAKAYETTEAAIKEANPELAERYPQIGEQIRIPLKKQQLDENNYYYHKVDSLETIYGICKYYNIKQKSLLKLNPELKKRSLMKGELIRIERSDFTDSLLAEKAKEEPVIKETVQKEFTNEIKVIVDSNECLRAKYDTINKYKIAVFLPFYLNINDTIGKYMEVSMLDEDGIEYVEVVPKEKDIEDKIFPNSKRFIEFYEGMLIAFDELRSKGMKFDIQVFDTQNDSLTTATLLQNPDLKHFNLFIGPVFEQNLDIISEYAWEHQINIVSPLSIKSDFIEHNPYAFQVVPPFEIQMKHASEFLNNFETKNYIVIHDGNNLNQEYLKHFKEKLYADMNTENYEQVKYNEVLYYDARDSVLKDVFSPDIQNIVIVPSNNQAFVSDVMGKLNGYSYDYDITTFGQPRWFYFNNIDLNNLHNTNTHIFSNSFVDYTESNVKQFVRQYRHYYKNEPGKNAFQGYDIAKYFGSALNKYGHDFRHCIHFHREELLQTRFNFAPQSDQSGYQNTSIFILEYTDDYKLLKVASFPK